MKYIWYSPKKGKYPLFIYFFLVGGGGGGGGGEKEGARVSDFFTKNLNKKKYLFC